MIDIFKILLLFVIPANIVLLVLLRYKINKSFGNVLSLIISYGIAPLFNSLIFYYLIRLFPERDGAFYLIITAIFWLIVFFLAYKNIKYALDLYKKYSNLFFKALLGNKINLLFLPVLFILIILTIQVLFYPIVDNDKALYLNQSEAVYQYKNFDWQKEKSVMIRGDDEYRYNSAIRPAIPYFVAFSLIINKESSSYFIFKFLSAYYYALLFVLFIFVIYKLSISVNKKIFNTIFFGSMFFVFSWGIGRMFVYSSKESLIYFFALLGLYLVYLLISSKEINLRIGIILGIVLGINSFINTHGIIIECITLLSLFIFSPIKIKHRIIQTIAIFGISLFAGGFEFLYMFNFIFINTIKNGIEQLLLLLTHDNNYISKEISREIVKVSNSNSAGSAIGDFDVSHQNLYQIKNFIDMYLKGKLQIFTNVGIFGFYFWFFIVILASNFKELIKNKIGKIILAFILIYFVVVIDPFNLNSSSYAIILWGSTKYAKLILMLSLVISSVYFFELLNKIFTFISKHIKRVVFLAASLLSVTIIFEKIFVPYLTKILLSVIPIYKEEIFYQNKVEIYYRCFSIFVFLVLISLILKEYKKVKKSFTIFIFASMFLFVVAPFFIVDIGKVPLTKTFLYLNKNLEFKLSNTIYEGDIYKTYFFAKSNLPKGTILKTNFNELYTHDDYFKLKRNSSNAEYGISSKCEKYIATYSFGNINLCKK